MQYFGQLETKYEEVFLTSSYMYFNQDDEEITVKDLKQMIKTNKDRKKNIAGTVFLYNPLVTPVGFDSKKFLLDQAFDQFDEWIELKCETYVTVFKNAMEESYKGKLVEFRSLFNLVEKNIDASSLLTKFNSDLEKYYSGQNTEFEREIMYQDCQNLVPSGKFVFFAWGDKINSREFKFIDGYARTLFERCEAMGKKIAFVYKKERTLPGAVEQIQFGTPMANPKYKHAISHAIKESFKTTPPTPQPYF